MVRIAERWVVSLTSDVARRERFFGQTQAAGFRVFDAVDMRGKTRGDWAELFDTDAFVARYGRPPAPGEVGCTLSHLTLIGQLASTLGRGEFALICEDDAVLLPELADVLAADVPARFDFVGLGMVGADLETGASWVPLSPRAKTIAGGRRLGLQWVGHASGTVGYLVSGSAAREIVKVARPRGPFWLADDLTVWSDAGLTIAGVLPVVITEEQTHPSNIGHALRDELRSGAPHGFEPRFVDFLHRRRKRQAVWFGVESVRSRLPLRVRRALPVRRLPVLDHWVNRAWRA